MAKPFDASTKFLVELNPADWLRLLGLPLGPTRIAEADFATVSSVADRLVVVEAPAKPYGLLVEFQGNVDATFEERLLEYSVLAKRRLNLPILAVAVLMRSFAGHSRLRGRHIVRGPDDELLLDFRYRVLRIWQMPPEAFLAGGLAVLPLATVARTRRSDLPRILGRINERLEAEATPKDADSLLTATFLLMGLKFEDSFVEKLMSQNILELSSTYRALQEKGIALGLERGIEQGIVQGIAQGERQGRAKEARRLILRSGTKRLGEPGDAVTAAIENIDDLEALEAINDRLMNVESWQELLSGTDSL